MTKTVRLRESLKLVAFISAMLCGFAQVTHAQNDLDSVGRVWPATGVTAPKVQHVLEVYVQILPAVEIGPSAHGTRRFIPITGGRFVGEGIKGEVIPGGADWQLERADGGLELTAIYALRTDDGAVIQVENLGLLIPDAEAPNGRYLASTPRFHAPAGKYDWMNKAIFTGTVTPVPDGSAVIIRIFKLLS